MGGEARSIYAPFDEESGQQQQQQQQQQHNVQFTPAAIPVTMAAPQYVQYGKWKDGMFDVFTSGGWPSMWMSCCSCLWPCLIGKIASRIRYSPSIKVGSTPFKQWAVLLTIIGAVYFLCYMGIVHANATKISVIMKVIHRCNPEMHDEDFNGKDFNGNMKPKPSDCEPTPAEQMAIDEADENQEIWDFITTFISIIFLIIVVMLRLRVRSKYMIPSSCEDSSDVTRRITACGLIEDVCCSCWCTCCTLAQMSRHTYAANECSPFSDPGPAESMEPIFPGQSHHVTQMAVINQASYGMYAATIPVATSVIPVSSDPASAHGAVVTQGMPCT